jgi:hypothetical protein
MDLLDVVILVSMGVLAVVFAGVAVLEWRDSRQREPQGAGAQVIQHPQSDRRVNPAA